VAAAKTSKWRNHVAAWRNSENNGGSESSGMANIDMALVATKRRVARA